MRIAFFLFRRPVAAAFLPLALWVGAAWSQEPLVPGEDPIAPPIRPEEIPPHASSAARLAPQAGEFINVPGPWLPQGASPISGGQVEGMGANSFVCGAIHTVVTHPTNPDIVYIGAVNGGVWKTTNATAANPTWTTTTSQLPSLSIGALAMDPLDATSNTVWAGIGRFSSYSRFGGSRSGLLRTTDGGTTWTVIDGGGVLVGKNISGIVVRGNTILVSVNTGDVSGNPNRGVWRSINGGTTFTQMAVGDGTGPTGLPEGVSYDIVGSPSAPNTLYTNITIPTTTAARGVYKSTDLGATWTRVSTPEVNNFFTTGTSNIEMSAGSSNNLYFGILESGAPVAIYSTIDGGTTWIRMDHPTMPVTTATVHTVTNATNASPVVITTSAAHGYTSNNYVEIAGVLGNTAANGLHQITVVSTTTFSLDFSAGNGAYTSGGTSRFVTSVNPRGSKGPESGTPDEISGGQGSIHFSIVADPTNANLVYVGGDRQDTPFTNYIGANNYSGNLWRGDRSVAPNGLSPSSQWRHLTHSNAIAGIPGGGTSNNSSPHADSRDMAFDANGQIVEVDDGGIFRRTSPQNNTGAWTSMAGNLQVTEMHSITYDTVSNIIISGNQDNGTSVQNTSGSVAYTAVSTADGGDVAAAPNPANPAQSIRYSSFQNLGSFRKRVISNTNTLVAQTFPALSPQGGAPAITGQFTTPVEINLINGNRLIIGGSNGVYESSDQGSTVSRISTNVASSGLDGGRTMVCGGRKSGVNNEEVLYYGSGVSVFRRVAAGVAPAAVVGYAGGTVRGIMVDPEDYDHVFVIDSNQVFRSTNGGTTFTDITGDMPAAARDFRCLEFIGSGSNWAVVAGTLRGVYASKSGAETDWGLIGSDLPNTYVWDMDYDAADNVLVVGTLGCGAWKFDAVRSILDGIDQSITFAPITDKITTDTLTLSATGGASGNPVTFAVTSGPAVIGGGNLLSFTGAGSVTITASQAGNAEYQAAPNVSRTFNVTKASATVTINVASLSQVYNGTPRIVTATTNPPSLPVTMTYNGSGTVPANVGSYAVVASINSPIYAGTASGTLVVSQVAQSITFAAIPTQLATATVNLAATGGASGIPVVFAVTGGPGSITGGTVLTFTTAGTVEITASQAGDVNYSAAPNVVRSFTVTKAPAGILLTGLTQGYNGTPRPISATTTPGGLSVVFTYNGSGTAPTVPGTHPVTGTVNDLRYQGNVAGTLTITKGSQTINFSTIPAQFSPNVLTLSATGGGSTSPVLFVVVEGPARIVAGNQVRFDGEGDVSVAATQAGDANYNAAPPVTRSFLVTKFPATVTLGNLSQTYNGTPRIVSAITDPAGLAVTYLYDNSTTPPVAPGIYEVLATIDEPFYEGAYQDYLIVGKGPQTIQFPSIPGQLANATVALSATGGGSGRVVTFEIASGPGLITGGNQLSFTGAGIVTVRARQTGNENYVDATPALQTVSVTKASATINLTDLSRTYDGLPKIPEATTVPSGLAVSFTYNGSVTAPVGADSYTVSAEIADARYQGTGTGTLVVGKAVQIINFPEIADQLANATVLLSATGGGSGNPVTLAVTDGPGTLSGGNSLSFTGAGAVAITASQTGGVNHFSATNVVRTITVSKATATVTLSALHQVSDGTPREVVVTTVPPGLDVVVTYDDLNPVPLSVGSYEVVAVLDDAIYEGQAADILVVDDALRLVPVPGGSLPALSSLGAIETSTFLLSRYEVTWGLWREVRDWAASNGYDLAAIGVGCADDQPVHDVNWFDAVKWCNARTEWENATRGTGLVPVYRTTSGLYRSGEPAITDLLVDLETSGYRLPSGIEWEYAARGGTNAIARTYPGGDQIDPLAWYAGNSAGADCGLSGGRGTWPAGRRQPNGLGLHELAGSVAEWTWDVDPGNSSARLALGGSWDSAEAACALGAIASETPSLRRNRIGLRVGRSVSSALAGALDNTDLAWDSGGDTTWYAQTTVNADGVDAAASGALGEGGEAWIETGVSGPGNITFRWRTSLPVASGGLRFEIDGAPSRNLGEENNWLVERVYIPAGDHTLRWIYERTVPASTPDPAEARAWLDEVAFVPATLPTVTTVPVSSVNETGGEGGGESTFDGGSPVTARGVVVGLSPDPVLGTAKDAAATVGAAAQFSVPIPELLPGTTYHARAYASNAVGHGYGENVYFTTDETVALTGGLGTRQRTILTGDRQVFHFTLFGPRHVDLGTLGDADLRAELYDGNGTLIRSFLDDSDVVLDELLLAGDYELHLYRSLQPGSPARTYDLTIDASNVAETLPDVAVGPSLSMQVGRGLRGVAAGQLATLTSREARAVAGQLTVVNAGTLPDELLISGSGGSRFFAVTYGDVSGNVTARILSGTFRTDFLESGDEAVSVGISVVPNKRMINLRRGKRTVTLKKTLTLAIRATSTFDPLATDGATFQVQTR